MAAQDKIKKYELEEDLLAIRGKAHIEIAKALTEILKKRNIDDSISQPTVSRHLKAIDDERKSASKAVLNEYIAITLPADLKILDELSQFYLTIFRNKLTELLTRIEQAAEKIEGISSSRVIDIGIFKGLLEDMKDLNKSLKDTLNVDLKERFMAGDRLHDIVKTKLKWVGIEGDEDERVGNLSEEDKELYSKIAQNFVHSKISKRGDDVEELEEEYEC